MKRERIKTNIIELDKLRQKPCKDWLERFVDGKIDAHEAFKKYGQEYGWLYENSDYDLIGWEIENGVFDWGRYGWLVAACCPENLDPDKYNWKDDSWAVARYCSDKLDPEKYNWKEHSWYVAKYCPDKLDPEKYNWKDASRAVAMYCPDKLDPERYNWERYGWVVDILCPDKFNLRPKK